MKTPENTYNEYVIDNKLINKFRSYLLIVCINGIWTSTLKFKIQNNFLCKAQLQEIN